MATTEESHLSLASGFRLGTWRADRNREDLVWAKRFTKEEDESLKKAVFDYIKSHGWAETEGLTKILNWHKKEARGCWMEISNCLPHRPIASIASRAHRLLDDVLTGKWSQEEEGSLRSLYTQFGQDWKKVAYHLGRNRKDVKDKWRHLKLQRAKGRWTQQELLRLCNMVHENLQLKSIAELKTNPNDHRMLRDDINWQLISDKLGSRPHSTCANEWYRTLASSMVADGEWANEDDRLFLLRLLESGASEEEAVEWHDLLKHRSGFSCMKRWKQMVKQLGESSHLPFDEKLQMLTRRYAPYLLEDDNFDDGCTRQP